MKFEAYWKPMRCIIMFGSPGSGKGTQSKLLDAHHISTGDILRKSELGQKWMAEHPGKLCPDEMINTVVQDKILDIATHCPNDFVLDGYPRTVTQATVLDWFLRTEQIPIVLIYLDVPVEMVIERMGLRGRPDDTPEIVKERMKVYEEETFPVFQKLKKLGHTSFVINAVGDPQEISIEIQKLIKK